VLIRRPPERETHFRQRALEFRERHSTFKTPNPYFETELMTSSEARTARCRIFWIIYAQRIAPFFKSGMSEDRESNLQTLSFPLLRHSPCLSPSCYRVEELNDLCWTIIGP
jgi:hypothetical protein